MAKRKTSTKRSHHGRGGRRKGAGRRAGPDGKTMTVSVSLPKDIVDRLDDVAAAENATRSELVLKAVRGWLARK